MTIKWNWRLPSKRKEQSLYGRRKNYKKRSSQNEHLVAEKSTADFLLIPFRSCTGIFVGNLSEKPRIFFVGAPKCGTTSPHRLLHGEGIIDAGSRKETFYFDYQYARGRGWYESLYETSGPHIPKADLRPHIYIRLMHVLE